MLFLALTPAEPLGYTNGLLTLFGLGLAMLLIAWYSKAKLIRSTHDFVIAGRKVGFGFGVAGLLSVWTWVVGILMPVAVTYQFGLSGLFWFAVPNGLAVVAVVPFARKLKRLMPHGYTISEFASVRFGGNKAATAVVVAGIVFGTLQAVIINLKGAALVVGNVFGMNEALVATIAAIIVVAYIVLGGLWASLATSTLMALFLLVPTAIVVVAGLAHSGGAQHVWETVASQGNGLLGFGRADAFQNFGITFTLALITATIAGQEFWSVAWGLREKELSRSFFWGGALYYPIALGLGVLGLAGLSLGVNLKSDLGGDAAALAPYLFSHLGVPVWVLILFVLIVLCAAYSTVDGALAGLSSIIAVDIFKRFFPAVSDKTLIFWTRSGIVLTVGISIAVILSGVNFVTLLLVTSAIRGSVLIPLILAIAWRRTSAAAFVSGTVVSLVAGIIARILVPGEVVATTTVIVTSLVVTVGVSLLNKTLFDYTVLGAARDLQYTDPTSELRDAEAAEDIQPIGATN